jgi:hypothetical protein
MKALSNLVIFVLLSLLFSSCGVVEGIFKAGMGFGIFIVVAIVVFILWAVGKARRR